MAKHKAERLDDRHQRENNTGCATCAGSDLADKKSVGDIVEVGHEHADRSWKTEGKHQFVDRRFGHLFILLFISFCHNKNLLLGYKDFAGDGEERLFFKDSNKYMRNCPPLARGILAQVFSVFLCGLREQKGILRTTVRAHNN